MLQIQTTIKKNNYLDNYQYVESRVIRNPKKVEQIYTNHIRRADTFTPQSQFNQKKEEKQSKVKVNNTSKERLSQTFHTNFRANKPDKINYKNNNINPPQDKKYISSTNKTNQTKTSSNKNYNDTKTSAKTEVKKASAMTNDKNKNDNDLKNKNGDPKNSIEQNNKNDTVTINNKDKNEKKDKIDIKQKFKDIEEFYKKFKGGNEYEDYKKNAENLVRGLTDILKADSPASDSTLKVCNFVDKIHKEDNYIIWSYVKKDDNKNILLSFLRELAFKKLVPTLDKIFMSGKGHYPLVNKLSKEYEKEFNELFDILPNNYQNELRFRTISYSEGDKDYACLLIGGTCLMGF